jgi:uncharacterized coiled-coil protein SlyX
LSRADEIAGEVRKLVMTVRTLEAQLQQSIPKKEHEQVVAKMQAQIDDLSSKLTSVKADLERAQSLNDQLSGMEAQLAAQNRMLSAQGDSIKGLAIKLEEGTVPYQLHAQAVSRVQELEKRVSDLEAQTYQMVPLTQYEALQAEMANTVPKAAYEELKATLDGSVPREELTQAQSRIAELEATVANSVPRSALDELKEKIASIMREAQEPPAGESHEPQPSDAVRQ